MNETRYRVWCTSWGETEEEGRDVVEGTELRGGAIVGVPGAIVRAWVFGPDDAAKVYAEYVHDHRDGYESSWPLTFRVRSPDGTTADFEVERDFSPTFRAARCKEQPAS